jgi:hypothetical protein
VGCKELKGTRPDLSPEWNGENVSGKTVLLHMEQGLGDLFQFVRYAPLVAARGATVIVACARSQVGIVSTVTGASNVLPYRDPLPAFDYYCPLLKLPLIFGTTPATIPSTVPYLTADPARVEAWAIRLRSSAFKVGIVWAGSAKHNSDKQRSCRIGHLAPLSGVPHVQLFSLQKGQQTVVPHGMRVTDLSMALTDFSETAAAIANLDLVITVDTACAHLAGALGKPIWLLNRYHSDWRWMREREDSPWYPTMRIFRQPRPGDWECVIEKVIAELPKVTRR